MHPVEITHYRFCAEDIFAVHSEDDPEDSMRARVLGAKVYGEAVFFFLRLERIEQFLVFRGDRYLLFPERIMIDTIMEKKIGQVRVTVKIDAEELMDLPLIPMRHRIDMRNCRRYRLFRRKLQCCFHTA